MLYDDVEKFKAKYLAFKEKYEVNETFERTDLCDIMDRNMSDKSYPTGLKENEEEHIRKRIKKPGHVVSFHNYTLFYDAFFSHVRDEEVNIFEIGLGSNTPGVEGWMGANARPGASVYGWSEYFTNGNIHGADIDQNAIFQDEEKRIKTYCVDQKSKEDVQKAFNSIGKKMDIIVDDGRHWPDYNFSFFSHSFDYLKEGGLFIIEDLFLSSHSRGDFKKHHYQNLEKVKAQARFADILRLRSKYGKMDGEGKCLGNNLMVILK